MLRSLRTPHLQCLEWQRNGKAELSNKICAESVVAEGPKVISHLDFLAYPPGVDQVHDVDECSSDCTPQWTRLEGSPPRGGTIFVWIGNCCTILGMASLGKMANRN